MRAYLTQIKSKGYARTKHTRTFMCAVDATESRWVGPYDTHTANVRSSGLWKISWMMEMRLWPFVLSMQSRIVRWPMLTDTGLDQDKAREGAHSLLLSIVELNKPDQRNVCALSC